MLAGKDSRRKGFSANVAHAQFLFYFRCSNRRSYSQWLENSWLERQPRFRCPLYHSMDRIGTSPQEHYSGWFLGMQRNRLDPAVDLLRVLPPRFGRGICAVISPAGLPTKSLFPLYSPSPETSGERATPARLSPSRTGVTCGQDAHQTRQLRWLCSFRSLFPPQRLSAQLFKMPVRHRTSDSLQRVEETIRAAEIDDAVCHER